MRIGSEHSAAAQRVPQANSVARQDPAATGVQPTSGPQAAGATSADPRSIAALSQALTTFLDQINAVATPAGAAMGDAAEAYGVPAGRLAANDRTAATDAHAALAEGLARAKEGFEGLHGRMASALAGGGDAAAARLSSEAADFAGGLMKLAEDVARAASARSAPLPEPQRETVSGTPAMRTPAEPQAAEVAQTRPTEAAEVRAASTDPKPQEKTSLFSAWGARLQRHLDEL